MKDPAKKKKDVAKKGKVFVATTKGAIVPFSKLQDAEIRKSSKQIEENQGWLTESGLVAPPYPPETFLLLYESNPVFWRCVNQLATDVAGLGWTLQLYEGKKENKTELKRLEEFLETPNKDEDHFRTILKKLLVDWGTIGWFDIEVVRNNKGMPAEIYHVAAHTLRVHKSKKKFCQKRNNKKVWFKRFGLKKDISPKDGNKGTFSIKARANELIHYKNFYPKSDFYGVPNAISAIGDIMGLIGLRDYNLSFFDNFGIPSAIIVLEGEWDKDSDKQISEFIKQEIQGTENAHRTLVVSQPKDCKFTYQALEPGKGTVEGSFRLYEQVRKDDILIAYSMPPERIGVRVMGKFGGNVAAEANKIYVQGAVEPLQLDLEDIINKQLLQSEIYEFKFNDVDVRDTKAEIEEATKLIEHGVKTPNAVRNNLFGLEPYPEGDKYYIMSSLVEVGDAQEPEEEESEEEEEEEEPEEEKE